MASEIDICNLALGHVRAGTISSLDENSVQAKQCKLNYPLMRDQMLQGSPWQFAGSIKPLAMLFTEVFNWAYVYQYPSDCLRVNRLILNFEQVNAENRNSGLYYPFRDEGLLNVAPSPTIEYKVVNVDGNKTICSNYSHLRIDYRVRITDTNLFSLNFVLALSHLLASAIAVPIVGAEIGRALRADSLSLYTTYVNAGVNDEMNEQKIMIAESDSIRVRN